jgi:hypothetical protein
VACRVQAKEGELLLLPGKGLGSIIGARKWKKTYVIVKDGFLERCQAKVSSTCTHARTHARTHNFRSSLAWALTLSRIINSLRERRQSCECR